ncbi:hypothetical protein [Sulfurivermis fontis]|uniref:hypothetical protein n=1 Tax=Sulfurivermis fontis TaxID=1972068 RepID=UPI000FDA2FBF|nr:hypothetical protein [Sulfurivermis fontis]
MPLPTQNERQLDRVVLLFLLALFLLVSPLLDWWAADGNPWYLPYLIWLGLIVAMYRLQRRARQDSHDL